MFVLTVWFEIKEEYVEEFRSAVRKQAENSLRNEPGCRQFDVCLDPEDDGAVFLYEVYEDAAAFDQHVKTSYFAEFQSTVEPWVQRKQRHSWHRFTT